MELFAPAKVEVKMLMAAVLIYVRVLDAYSVLQIRLYVRFAKQVSLKLEVYVLAHLQLITTLAI